MLNKSPKPVVTIYACGGTAVNLGYALSLSSMVAEESIYCSFRVCYIDTSHQNFLGKDIDVEKQAFIFDVNGSGQVRASVYEYIMNNRHGVFRKFPPTEINIVLFGLGGGTGSTAGPILMNDLVTGDKPVISFGVGAVDTLKHAKNTQATISTLQNFSIKSKKPFIFNYQENVPGATEDHINKTVIFNIITTAILLSGAVDRIDSNDISNLLNYTRVTDQDASLTGFNIVVSNDPLSNHIKPFAGLSVHRTESVVPRIDDLDFKKIGFLEDMPGNSDSIHFYLDKPSIQETYDRVVCHVVKLKKASESRKQILTMQSSDIDSGFVL